MPARYDDDDDDDRPRKNARRRDDDEDDDDRPRKKKKAKKKGGLLLGLIAGGAVLLLLVAAGGAYFLFGGKRAGLPLGGVIGPAAPPGYSVARQPAGEYVVFLPGQSIEMQIKWNGVVPASSEMCGHTSAIGLADQSGTIMSWRAAAGYTPGTSADQLFAELKTRVPGLNAKWNIQDGRKTVPLGGVQGLEVRTRHDPHWIEKQQGKMPEMPDDPNAPAFFREAQERHRQFDEKMRKDDEKRNTAQEGNAEHYVYYIAVKGTRIIVITITKKGGYPDEETVKTVRESFGFI